MNPNSILQTNPFQSVFPELQKIISMTVFKDAQLADSYETQETRAMAELYLNAKIQRDSWVTYKNWWTIDMFLEVQNNVTYTAFRKYYEDPFSVPVQFRDILLERSRDAFLTAYEEKNTYYRMLMGKPPIGTNAVDFLYMSQSMEDSYHSEHIPIHLLPPYIQNAYIGTQEYADLVKNNPDKPYIKFIGRKKVDLYTARKAKDFEIIYYPTARDNINPYLLKAFSSTYADYREYVMVVLYNRQLQQLHPGYRAFMGGLILSFTLLQIGNKGLEGVNNRQYIDDTVLHTVLELYGIPDTLLMTTEVRRNLAANLLRLVREKGTSEVYYDLADILGYEDVTISKLMLMKGQQFISENGSYTSVDVHLRIENGKLIYSFDSFNDVELPDLSINENGEVILRIRDANDYTVAEETIDEDRFSIRNHELYVTLEKAKDIGDALNDYEPYFLQLDLKDKDPYETITTGRAPIYSYHEIVDGDPMWWDLDDVHKILKDYKYTMSDSKYITIEATVHQNQFIYESIYFARMILDNPLVTQYYSIDVPELFGAQVIPIYDLVLFLVCATCMTNNLTGEIITETDVPLATAGYNFDINFDNLAIFLSNAEYIDKNRLNAYLSEMSISTVEDIGRVFNDIMPSLRNWLETEMAQTTDKDEFIEYESVYRALFTYDVTRNRCLDTLTSPVRTIQNTYGISDAEMSSYASFYPHIRDQAVQVGEFNENGNITKYHYPFLSAEKPVDWFIHITYDTPNGTEDRGYLYFYDILNSPDLQEHTERDGLRVLMDYNSESEGWVVNQRAVTRALELIDQLDENQLVGASYQIYTVDADGNVYDKNQPLPPIIITHFKQILHDKVEMDMKGLAKPPKTYFNLLERKNEALYNVLMEDDRFHRNPSAWMSDVGAVMTTLESHLSIHMKYFEESVLGGDLFFKPLIAMIKHFKSILVEIARTGLKYVFDDKVDAGGSSHMFKIFDILHMTDHSSTIGDKWSDKPFGLYDAEHSINYGITIKDRTEMIKYLVGQGFAAEERRSTMGSLRMVDEVKIFKNGKEVDPDGNPSYWRPDEPGLGRWSPEDEFLMRARDEIQHVKSRPLDTEGWKDFVPSYIFPEER